jgi:1-deoxy-D-xylulose-5-phosphate reductoisomerase
MSKIAILGSTGSIGTQTIDVILDQSEHEVTYISAGGDSQLLADQAKLLGLSEDRVYKNVRVNPHYLSEIVSKNDVDIVVNGVVGFAGLEATARALELGKVVALANKESLVAGGQLLMDLEAKHGGLIVPVDSEHSALFQCLWANSHSHKQASAVDEIIITASGGPFRGYTREQLENVSLADAVKHPTWSMGQKISIDSSTLMNKGLEVIEAQILFSKFGVGSSNIKVTVHPQSLIHGMVTFTDGATIAQISNPTMKLPIAMAINYATDQGEIVRSGVPYGKVDWSQSINMTFEPPNLELFRCLEIAYLALDKGGVSPCVINAANEVAVQAFIEGKISWLSIPDIVFGAFDKVFGNLGDLNDVYAADKEAREVANDLIS